MLCYVSEKLVASGPNPVALATPQVATSSPMYRNVGVENIKLSRLLVHRNNEFKMNEIQCKTPQ